MENGPFDFTEKIESVLFGVAVGDALGLPVQFNKREDLKESPVKNMIGYGTFNKPPGTWSDDSSLTFCLAEALTKEFNLNQIAKNFLEWFYKGYWTPEKEAFDVGITTRRAIYRLSKGTFPEIAGGADEFSNGNGSLMRISPLVFYIFNKKIDKRFEITRQVSSITHRHIRSIIACFYYLEFARLLLDSKDKFGIYRILQTEILDFLDSIKIDPGEISKFDGLLKGSVYGRLEEEILSSGYVVHTLEASIWCILTTDNFKDAVLKAVNLGEDSDTTGAITGALTGLLYGYKSIPCEWINILARKKDIEDLSKRLGAFLKNDMY